MRDAVSLSRRMGGRSVPTGHLTLPSPPSFRRWLGRNATGQRALSQFASAYLAALKATTSLSGA